MKNIEGSDCGCQGIVKVGPGPDTNKPDPQKFLATYYSGPKDGCGTDSAVPTSTPGVYAVSFNPATAEYPCGWAVKPRLIKPRLK